MGTPIETTAGFSTAGAIVFVTGPDRRCVETNLWVTASVSEGETRVVWSQPLGEDLAVVTSDVP